MAKPPTSSRKQAKGEQRALATAPRPPKPTRAACGAAERIRARGGVVAAEFGRLAIAERAAQLTGFRERIQAICADEQAPLEPADRGHDVVLSAGRQMERTLGRLAAEVERAPHGGKRPAPPAARGRSSARPKASLLAAQPPESRGARMDLGKLVDEAKELVEERGGVDSLKADAEELKDIATGDGSVVDKAKAAAEAVKDAGQAGPGN
ncbi:MAG TPA: hypothetical protein VGK92_14150 [Gaiellales bacterium]